MENDKKTVPALKTPELLSRMLDCVGSPVFAKDGEHRWIYFNKAFCAFMGRTAEELLGRDDRAFFPKDQADVFWERDNEVFRTRAEDVNEEFLTDAAGKHHIILTRKQVFKDSDGHDVLVGIINDITELKKANSGLSMFRQLLENSSDAIFIISPKDGSFLDVNDTACARLGYSRQALLRMTVADIESTAAGPGGWQRLTERILAAGALLIEGTHKRSDGTTFPVEVGINKTVIDGKDYILANARDITERRKMQEAMKEVDTLRGLIPICAKCKKIRDDKGFWQKVEIYLEKRSNARFTHGLCKDCMKELYGKETWFDDADR